VQNIANPIAMILAFFHEEDASRVWRAIYEAVLDGTKTAHRGVHRRVTRHVRNKLEVWSALA
jgi:isocitrate/isopropylmalate dehydrogenase